MNKLKLYIITALTLLSLSCTRIEPAGQEQENNAAGEYRMATDQINWSAPATLSD